MSVELERYLESRGKRDLVNEIRTISNLVRSVAYVRQGEPLGLGHAVLTARPLVGNEPFAVILADDVIDATPSALAQMMDVFNKVDGPVILVERIPKAQISGYGVIAAEPDAPGRVPRHRSGREAGARGRTVRPGHHRPLHSDARHLRGARGGSGNGSTGEIQLTNGLKRLLPHAADLRVRGHRRAPRHRQQAGLSEGGGVLRAAASRSGWTAARVRGLASAIETQRMTLACGGHLRPEMVANCPTRPCRRRAPGAREP